MEKFYAEILADSVPISGHRLTTFRLGLSERSLTDLRSFRMLSVSITPSAWPSAIVTATEWENLFGWGTSDSAPLELRSIAEAMKCVYDANKPTPVGENNWHLPLIFPTERSDRLLMASDEIRMISAARCARGARDAYSGGYGINADLELYRQLVTSGHLVSLEHVATPFSLERWSLHSKFREYVEDYAGHASNAATNLYRAAQFDGNLRGWTQLRNAIA